MVASVPEEEGQSCWLAGRLSAIWISQPERRVPQLAFFFFLQFPPSSTWSVLLLLCCLNIDESVRLTQIENRTCKRTFVFLFRLGRESPPGFYPPAPVFRKRSTRWRRRYIGYWSCSALSVSNTLPFSIDYRDK